VDNELKHEYDDVDAKFYEIFKDYFEKEKDTKATLIDFINQKKITGVSHIKNILNTKQEIPFLLDKKTSRYSHFAKQDNLIPISTLIHNIIDIDKIHTCVFQDFLKENAARVKFNRENIYFSFEYVLKRIGNIAEMLIPLHVLLFVLIKNNINLINIIFCECMKIIPFIEECHPLILLNRYVTHIAAGIIFLGIANASKNLFYGYIPFLDATKSQLESYKTFYAINAYNSFSKKSSCTRSWINITLNPLILLLQANKKNLKINDIVDYVEKKNINSINKIKKILFDEDKKNDKIEKKEFATMTKRENLPIISLKNLEDIAHNEENNETFLKKIFQITCQELIHDNQHDSTWAEILTNIQFRLIMLGNICELISLPILVIVMYRYGIHNIHL
jgi:hypothetical protein